MFVIPLCMSLCLYDTGSERLRNLQLTSKFKSWNSQPGGVKNKPFLFPPHHPHLNHRILGHAIYSLRLKVIGKKKKGEEKKGQGKKNFLLSSSSSGLCFSFSGLRFSFSSLQYNGLSDVSMLKRGQIWTNLSQKTVYFISIRRGMISKLDMCHFCRIGKT